MEKKNSIELDEYQEEDSTNIKEPELRKRKRPSRENQVAPLEAMLDESCNLHLPESMQATTLPTPPLKFQELLDEDLSFH